VQRQNAARRQAKSFITKTSVMRHEVNERKTMLLAILIGIIVVALLLAAAVPMAYFRWKQQRRRQWFQTPFPPEWTTILEQDVALYRVLPPDLQRELQGHIQVFLQEKEFEGCAGFEVTLQVKLVLAALACLLLLNKPQEYYPTLRSVLIYPGAFLVNGRWRENSGVYEDGMDVHLGESWQHGAVALAWDQVLHDSRRPRSRQNVVIHEFAHQIDQHKGFSEGAAVFASADQAERFARAVRREFEHLRHEVDDGIDDVIDEYGVVSPMEFFAVATEAFFTMPEELRRFHAELYNCLVNFYRLDPASWRDANGNQ